MSFVGEISNIKPFCHKNNWNLTLEYEGYNVTTALGPGQTGTNSK
jgi:hypothetical protein